MPGVVVDEGARIDGSIIGPRAKIGAGASLRPTCVVAADFLVPSTTVAEGDARLA
jgi:ADP-glucose pyrophosphorylase